MILILNYPYPYNWDRPILYTQFLPVYNVFSIQAGKVNKNLISKYVHTNQEKYHLLSTPIESILELPTNRVVAWVAMAFFRRWQQPTLGTPMGIRDMCSTTGLWWRCNRSLRQITQLERWQRFQPGGQERTRRRSKARGWCTRVFMEIRWHTNHSFQCQTSSYRLSTEREKVGSKWFGFLVLSIQAKEDSHWPVK